MTEFAISESAVSDQWSMRTLRKLADLWISGVTSTQIAMQLGKTKNAVVGKAHRLGLPQRASPLGKSHMTADQIQSVHKEISAGRSAAEVSRIMPLPIGEEALRTFVRKRVRPTVPVQARPKAPPSRIALPLCKTCQFPTSDGRPWTFCDSTDMEPRTSYCRHHARVCFSILPHGLPDAAD